MIKHRCWGIGLGRTGTTSLCQAFSLLGYKNVVHNPLFHHLREADAGADNGVTIYYKYLDYKYPDSKFVLTLRDVDDWLPSIKYILDKYPVLSRDDDEPIKRRMLLYEAVAFDEEKFRQAYARHTKNIRAYFKNRPQDLLEMNITAGEGWEKLCPFLGLPVPDASFPYMNQRG